MGNQVADLTDLLFHRPIQPHTGFHRLGHFGCRTLHTFRQQGQQRIAAGSGDTGGGQRVVRVADKLGQLHIKLTRRSAALRVLNQRAAAHRLNHKPADKSPAAEYQRYRLLRLLGRNQPLIGRVRIAQPPVQTQAETDAGQIVTHCL